MRTVLGVAPFNECYGDGVTSGAILTKYLKRLNVNVYGYAPPRTEGYGLTKQGVDNCVKLFNPDLIITVDLGINANEVVKYANDKNVDVIITDHHEPDENVAKCIVVNPKIGNDENLKDLCGAGVAFKLAHALSIYGTNNDHKAPLQYYLSHTLLPLCSIGTVADIVPLKNDNRILVKYGLEYLQSTEALGVKALLHISGVSKNITTYDAGFKLAPRLNAAGRISQPEDAFNLLMSDDKTDANDRSTKLDELNIKRKEVEAEATKDYLEALEESFDELTTYGIVVASNKTHPGIAGIVASRIVNKYNRPSIVCNIDDRGNCKGSCRSVNDFNMIAALKHCSDLLDTFGGHKGAAGVAFKLENLEAFQHKFNDYVKAHVSLDELAPVVNIDSVLDGNDINWDLYDQLELLEPYGCANKEPIFSMIGCTLHHSKAIGKEQNHLKTSIQSADGMLFGGIMFNYDAYTLPSGKLDIAFQIKVNEWRGDKTLQLQLLDIKGN